MPGEHNFFKKTNDGPTLEAWERARDNNKITTTKTDPKHNIDGHAWTASWHGKGTNSYNDHGSDHATATTEKEAVTKLIKRLRLPGSLSL